MTRTRFHTQHFGELHVQKKRHTPTELANEIPSLIETNMPSRHAEFYTGLSYLPLAILDKAGRPWASLLVNESDNDLSVGITVSQKNALCLRAKVGQDDPFYRALAETKLKKPNTDILFAGVGVDFSNRRRNKLAGLITSAEREESGIVNLSLHSNEHLGNCPKYITVRDLAPKTRSAETIFDNFDSLSIPLSSECKEHINKVSTVFLASKHSADKDADLDGQGDMGLNHRGGNPGFIRVYEESDDTLNEAVSINTSTYLILPDYSGNRFYQSLGNIQSDELVGLCLPDFSTGNMLSLTGVAENIFDDDAKMLMPRMSLVTRIRITGAVFIKQAIDLTLLSKELLSPYNPPIRYLRRELEAMGRTPSLESNGNINARATLASISELTPTISTFSFKLSEPIQPPIPGGFCVFDFSELLDTGYSHMNPANPKLVNEDYIRTWTISSAPQYDSAQASFTPTDTLNVTVKLKAGGLVSTFLHDQKERFRQGRFDKIELSFNGVGGDFSCFSYTQSGALTLPRKMLWVAGGVGITPFMAMWEELLHLVNQNQKIATNLVLVFAGREQDLELLEPFLAKAASLPESVSINVKAYLTTAESELKKLTQASPLTDLKNHPKLSIEHRRICSDDFKAIDKLAERQVYFCGSTGLVKQTKTWLQANGCDSQKFHEESFAF